MSLIKCPNCLGKGAFPPDYYDCSTCMGSGMFDTERYATDAYGAWCQARLKAGESVDKSAKEYYDEVFRGFAREDK